jgi:hypothetical protein
MASLGYYFFPSQLYARMIAPKNGMSTSFFRFGEDGAISIKGLAEDGETDLP